MDSGTAWCWGANSSGQLGAAYTDAWSDWQSLSVATFAVCATRSGGSAWCWGFNDYGFLGDGSTRDARTPVEVSGGPVWRSVASDSRTHSCGIRAGGSAWCWGNNFLGALGNDTTEASLVPTGVSGSATWQLLTVGESHTCGIRTNGTAWCWGANGRGELGDGSLTESRVPIKVRGGGTWQSLAAGRGYTCGIKTDGSARCWGSNRWGRLGDGITGRYRRPPTAVSGGGTWQTLSAGYTSTCGIKSDGAAWCWGNNFAGHLGDGTTSDRPVPTAVSGGGAWTSIATSGHTCGVRTDGTAWCWGYNEDGSSAMARLAHAHPCRRRRHLPSR